MNRYYRTADYFRRLASKRDAHPTHREYHDRLAKWSEKTGWRKASEPGREAALKLGLGKFAIDHSQYLYHPEKEAFGVLTEPYAGALSPEVLTELFRVADEIEATVQFVQGHAFWNPLHCIPILTIRRA